MIYNQGLSGTNWWDAPYIGSQDQLTKLSSVYGVSFVYNPNASDNYKYTVGRPYGASAWSLWTQIGTAFNGDVNAAVSDWKQQNAFQTAEYAWGSGVTKGADFIAFMASKGVTASNNKYMADLVRIQTIPVSTTTNVASTNTVIATASPSVAVPINTRVPPVPISTSSVPMETTVTPFSISPLMLAGIGIVLLLVMRK